MARWRLLISTAVETTQSLELLQGTQNHRLPASQGKGLLKISRLYRRLDLEAFKRLQIGESSKSNNIWLAKFQTINAI